MHLFIHSFIEGVPQSKFGRTEESANSLCRHLLFNWLPSVHLLHTGSMLSGKDKGPQNEVLLSTQLLSRSFSTLSDSRGADRSTMNTPARIAEPLPF